MCILEEASTAVGFHVASQKVLNITLTLDFLLYPALHPPLI